MTGSNTTSIIPFSEKLSLVIHHHLLTRVPVKLDLNGWNYGWWEFFFEQLSESYEVDKFLRTPATKSSTNSIAPLTPEEIKVDSLINILTSLEAHVNDEDVVHYVVDGLPDTYNHVCGYMHWKDTFPDLKTVWSFLIAKEMQLKSRALASPMDSSSPMVLVAETGTNRRTSSMAQGKSWKPCFNFAKGSCRIGDHVGS
ncbi:hypothetical protein Tco_0724227 [Tanacetum coccineum]